MQDPRKYNIDYPWVQFLRDSFSYLGVKKWQYVGGVSLGVFAELAWLYFPVGMGQVVDFLAEYSAGESVQPLILIGILLTLSMLARHVGWPVAKWLSYRAGEYAANKAIVAGYKKLFRLGGEWHAAENSGNKVKRVDRGATSIAKLHRFVATSVVTVLVALPGALIIVGSSDIWLAVVLMVFAVVYTLLTRRFITKGARYSHAVSQEDEKVSGLAFETVNNIRTVQTGSLWQRLETKLESSVKDMQGFIFKRIRAFQIGAMPALLFADLSRVGLLGYVSYGVIQGRFDVGLFVVVISMFHHVWHATAQLTELTREILVTRYGVYRLKEVMLAEDYLVDQSTAVSFPKDWNELQLKNVSFVYEDGQKTLTNINFSVQRGEKIGLVGLSGAGKSTLFKLLTRERVPTKGDIMVDGLSIQDIQFRSYFDTIGVMLQDTELFSFSLKENVTLATKRTNVKRFNHALKIAHVNDFLHKLPDGVHTKIGEKGFKLSGGEKQRVGIARAVYHAPEILFFDEATSHLDVESEKKIQNALSKVFENTTAVVIAHRLSTIKEMDRILVMHKGKIVEEGSFDVLMRQEGRFYKLWEQQKL